MHYCNFRVRLPSVSGNLRQIVLFILSSFIWKRILSLLLACAMFKFIVFGLFSVHLNFLNYVSAHLYPLKIGLRVEDTHLGYADLPRYIFKISHLRDVYHFLPAMQLSKFQM